MTWRFSSGFLKRTAGWDLIFPGLPEVMGVASASAAHCAVGEQGGANAQPEPIGDMDGDEESDFWDGNAPPGGIDTDDEEDNSVFPGSRILNGLGPIDW